MCLYLLYFWGCSVYAVLAPFYPPIAIEKGMSKKEIGYLFSIYAIIAFFFSPVSGKVMNKIGRKNVLLIGGIIESLGLLVFGFVIDLEGNAFVTISVIGRMLMGIGGSALLITCFAVISNQYPESMEAKIGIMEAIGGVGLMAGPAIGGVLYYLTSYKFVFIIYTLIFVGLTVTAYKILPDDNPEIQSESNKFSYLALFKLKKIYLTLIVVIFGMAGPAFLEPVLADNLKKDLGLSSLWIGIFFALPTLGYTVGLKLLIMTPKQVDRRHILFAGMFIEGVSFTVIGPWSGFGKPWIISTAFGLILVGFGSAWAYIPSLPYLIDSAAEEFTNVDRECLSNSLSTIMGATHYLGESAGPIIGGIMNDEFGNDNGYALFGLFVLCYFVFYGISNNVFKDVANRKFYLEEEERKINIGPKSDEIELKYEVLDKVEKPTN